jgi:hypothetical protein
MKKLKYFLMLALVAMGSISCEDDQENAVLKTTDAKAASIVSPADGSSYILKLSEGKSIFGPFTWTEADYGADLPRNYKLVMANTNDINDAIEIVTTSSISYELTVADFNLLLYDAGFKIGENDVFFHVIATVKNAAVDTLISSASGASITGFSYDQPNLSSPENEISFVLKKENADDAFATFLWTEVDYGDAYAVEYSIEFDAANNNFSTAVELASVTSNTYTGTIGAVNKALIKAGFNADAMVQVEFRVVSSIEGKKGFVEGTPIKMNLTTYSEEGGGEVVPPLYLVGNATLAGWDNTKGLEIAWDKTNNNYSIVTEFVAGGMKILQESGKWAPQWGDDGSNTGILSFRPTETDPDPAEIASPGVGTFKLIVDIENLTYVFEEQ